MLGYGNHVREPGGIAVHCCGRGEDNVCDVVLGHCTKESDGAANVDAIVFERDVGGLAYSLRLSVR